MRKISLLIADDDDDVRRAARLALAALAEAPVVRQVATNHGGQVSVSANPRGGACFRLSLPDR